MGFWFPVHRRQSMSKKNDFSRSFTRRDFLSKSLKTGAAAFTTGLLQIRFSAKASGRYNVLFIIVDDLRPAVGVLWSFRDADTAY